MGSKLSCSHTKKEEQLNNPCKASKLLRAAAPAADPGKEKPVMVSAGFVRVFCESSAWMLYIYIIYIYASNSIYLYVEVKFC